MIPAHKRIIGIFLIVSLGALFGYLFAFFRLGPMLEYTTLDVTLVFCITAPVLYATSKYYGIRGLLITVAALTIVHSILLKYSAKEMHAQLLIYYLVSGLTIRLYQAHIAKALHKLRVGKFIIFAGLFVVAYFLVLVIGRIFSVEMPITRSYMLAWHISVFVTFGVGLGIELSELIIRISMEPFSSEGIINDRASS